MNGNTVTQDSSHLFKNQNQATLVVPCILDSLRRTCLLESFVHESDYTSHTVFLHAVCEDNSTERCTYISVIL